MARQKGDPLDFVPRGMTSSQAREISRRNQERAANSKPEPENDDFDVRDVLDDDLVIGFESRQGRKKVR